jgi:hypothetical protein
VRLKMIHGTVHGAFRSIVSAGWNVKSGGEVEAVTGHFAIVEIPAHAGERAEMRDAVFSDNPDEEKVFDSIPAGWFMVIEDSQGNVGLVNADNEADAHQMFQNAEAEYAEWAGDGE